jgi:hypothetical protein
MGRVQWVTAILCIGILITIFQLIRKNRLMEKYSLLWILSVMVLLLMCIWPNLLKRLSALVGIIQTSNALFFMAIICGMVISLHFSVVISKLTKQNHALAQEIALIKHQLDENQKNADLKVKSKA